MFEDINNADLVSPTNTNIVLRTILLCENKDQIELSDGTRLSMNHGIHLFSPRLKKTMNLMCKIKYLRYHF